MYQRPSQPCRPGLIAQKSFDFLKHFEADYRKRCVQHTRLRHASVTIIVHQFGPKCGLWSGDAIRWRLAADRCQLSDDLGGHAEDSSLCCNARGDRQAYYGSRQDNPIDGHRAIFVFNKDCYSFHTALQSRWDSTRYTTTLREGRLWPKGTPKRGLDRAQLWHDRGRPAL